MYFIACKTSPISRNNARYDNAIKASLMMMMALESEVFYGRQALGQPTSRPAGRLAGASRPAGWSIVACRQQAGKAERSWRPR